MEQRAHGDAIGARLARSQILKKFPQQLFGSASFAIRSSFDKDVLRVLHPATGDSEG